MRFDSAAISNIAKRYRITRVWHHGEYIIIEAPKGLTLIDLEILESEIRILCGQHVRVVTTGSLRDARIFREADQIYP